MRFNGEFGDVVRQNWALIVAIGVLVGGAGIAYMRGASNDPENLATDAERIAYEQQASTRGSEARPQRKTPQELALEQIAEYESKIEANPDDADTPAYLLAMGNLHRQKLINYEKAAECYERLLVDYPDWDGVRVVYMQLATCYERLDETQKARDVYEKMIDVFPEDSQEHAIAYDAVFR